MAKTMYEERTAASSPSLNETKKQRKKQAKREAKMMLKLEQARRSVQKSEQKLIKSQAALATNKTHLSDLEAQVQALLHPSVSATQQQESSTQANVGNHSTPTTKKMSKATTSKKKAKAIVPVSSEAPADNASSLPLAEGQADIDPAHIQESASPNPEPEQTAEEPASVDPVGEPEQPSSLLSAVAEMQTDKEPTPPLIEENTATVGETEHAPTD